MLLKLSVEYLLADQLIQNVGSSDEPPLICTSIIVMLKGYNLHHKYAGM